MVDKPASSEDRWNILRLLQWSTDFFRKHGSDSPRLDAEVLLAFVLGQPRIQLYTAFDREPDADQLARYRQLVKRRAQGEPVAYLVGQREFFSLPLQVDRRVLIPRPETEHLVVAALDEARLRLAARPATPVHVADVGTGCGAIAIAIAKHCPEATVWASDQSTDALEVARENVQRAQLEGRITLAHADLLTGAPQPFDLVVSNPPYVREDEFDKLPPDVREFEPRGALVAGPRGMEVIERLIEAARHCLRPEGTLIFEHSPQLSEACTAALAGWREVRVKRDLAGLCRLHLASPPAK
jgi:release factor glutamine methyltransferase